MEIEHILDGSQVDYGYIWWPKKENDRYGQVFPDGEFTIDLEGRRLSGKKVDWKRGRVSIGQKPMQELFQKNDKVIISWTSTGVLVGKIGSKPPPNREHPLVIKLREHQRDSENPSNFEKTVAEAFTFVGFTTKHIGGRDEPDVLLEDVNAIIDSKTTKEGVISERYINFDAMERYREKHGASFLAIVAPGFSEGNIRHTAAKKGIVLIATEAICRLIENHAYYPYELALVSAVLFESGKTVISPDDIPSSLIKEDELIELAAGILKILKQSARQFISVNELCTFYGLQGLSYSADEVEKALLYLSNPPFQILHKEGDQFKLSVDFQTLSKRIGLLVEVFSRFSRAQ